MHGTVYIVIAGIKYSDKSNLFQLTVKKVVKSQGSRSLRQLVTFHPQPGIGMTSAAAQLDFSLLFSPGP